MKKRAESELDILFWQQYEEFVNKNRSKIERYAQTIAGSYGPDLAQEAIIKYAYYFDNNYSDLLKIRYLYRITRSLWMDRAKRKQNTELSLDEKMENGFNPSLNDIAEDQSPHIPQLDCLTKKILTLDQQGLSNREIAYRVKKSVGYVKQILSDTKRQIKARVTPTVVNRYGNRINTRHSRKKGCDYLLRIAPEKENWMSIPDFMRLTGRSRTWIELRLQPFAHMGRYRDCLTGRTTQILLCYPHVVMEEILRMHNHWGRFSKSDNWITVHKIATLIKRNFRWVLEQIRIHRIRHEIRQLPDGRYEIVYPPNTVQILLDSAKKYPPKKDWLNQEDIRRIIGRSYDWIRIRLQKYNNICELRREEKRGSITKCYPPEIINELQKL